VSTDDRDDFYPPTARPAGGPPFPTVVMVAGVIWIIVGAVALVNVVLTLALAGANAAAQPGQPGGQTGGVCCGLLVGIAFLVCGIQTVKGTAKDTLGNGIGSILIGGFYLVVGLGLGLLGALGGAGAGQNPNLAPLAGVLLIAMVIAGGIGAALVLAGILALVGRGAYREWRRAYGAIR
jgi:hypothetical protein